MNLSDLPDHIDVPLAKDEGIAYPQDGEMVYTYQVRMHCFNTKQYLKTWPIRQRIMQANTELITRLKSLDIETKEDADFDDAVDGEQFGQMMLMSGFDLLSGMEEFKQLAVAGKLIELDEGVHLTKERWATLDDIIKEKLCFCYLAAFILPCVV